MDSSYVYPSQVHSARNTSRNTKCLHGMCVWGGSGECT